MARLVQDDRKATVTQITAGYNQDLQKTISEPTTRPILKQMGYSSRRPHQVPLLSANNRKLRLQFTPAHQNWTIEDWKNVAWSDESGFLLPHSDVYPSSDGYFQQDNAPCHKAQIISNWFLEHDNEFTVLQWPPQSPDLSPVEHLWDVVEREIHIMDVQPTNLQQLCDAIMSIWTKTSEECFQHLVESMTPKIKAVLKAKGVRPGTSKVYLIKWPFVKFSTEMEMQLPPHEGAELSVVDMHTGGEPLRIIHSGYPEVKGDSVLSRRRYVREHLDHLRRVLMYEPRGHYDMYGALIVDSEIPEADLGVLFMHNEGYSTMCGHAVIALGRYAVDYKLVKEPKSPETQVNIHCPCGLVKAFVEYSDGKTGGVRFLSVPAFAFATDVTVTVERFGDVTVDISYGGAFYAFVDAQRFGLDVTKSRTRDLVDAATAVTNAVKAQVKLHHPTSDDLAFLYGTILTDGKDNYSSDPTANICVFAEAQVDRSPTGSGVTARVALQYHKGLIQLNQTRTFQSGATGSQFTGKAVEETKCGDFKAVVVEVAGRAFYTGVSRFVQEPDDKLTHGFLLK